MKDEQLRAELEKGLCIATGCTEPVAIAYAGALARAQAAGEIERIQLSASANIIKNAFVVGIPGTDLTGLKYAVAIGAVCGNPQRKLELLEDLAPQGVRKAKGLVETGKVELAQAQTDQKLYIRVRLLTQESDVIVEISGAHTNVSRIVKNGETVYSGGCGGLPADGETPDPEYTLEDIYTFCMRADCGNFGKVGQAIRLNRAVAKEGLESEYGLCVGRTLAQSCVRGILADDVAGYAMRLTSAASDARMAGADLPVMSNSGSGNQGIAATLPVVAVWERLDGKDGERLLRACALSNFVTIYIKRKFGVLSALCGAVVAGAGAACGVTCLMGGTLRQMEYAIQNTLGNVAGMLCDGAKASCALKISTCTNAAMQAALLAMQGRRIRCNEGIVEEFSERTIDNFARLGNEGANGLDSLVLDMIIQKEVL